jgi:ABC-type branched-subunit amino acid transport system permease subunit
MSAGEGVDREAALDDARGGREQRELDPEEFRSDRMAHEADVGDADRVAVTLTARKAASRWRPFMRSISTTSSGATPLMLTRPMPFGIGIDSAGSFYYATLVVFVLAVASMFVLARSPFGASVCGARDQARRMTALGYNVWLTRFLAFLLSRFWSGVAGILYLYYNQFISPQVASLQSSAEVLLMVIVGGAGSLLGPIAGAAIVVIVKNVVSAYVVRWNLVLGVIFVIIITFLPEGLVPGSVRLWRAGWKVVRARSSLAPSRSLGGRSS